MENTKQLEYFWIKTEADNNINIIIKAEPSILDKEIAVSFIDGKLVIECEGTKYTTGEFPIDVHYSILNKYTKIVFAHEDGEPFFSFDLPPTLKKKNKP